MQAYLQLAMVQSLDDGTLAMLHRTTPGEARSHLVDVFCNIMSLWMLQKADKPSCRLCWWQSPHLLGWKSQQGHGLDFSACCNMRVSVLGKEQPCDH